MAGPLEHIKVVELTIAIQGPGAGLYLCDMGADVIKVEPPVGDASRYHRGVNNNLPPEAMGPQFVSMNRGKQSVCVDIHTDLGRSAVLKLIEGADVFLSNYRLDALDRMGLGFDSLHALNPRLVYATVNGFGPAGPDAGKSMLDGTAIARGGLASLNGTADSGPMLPGPAIADTAGAMQLALATVTALVARDRDGIGQQVQTSALGAQMWLQQWELTHAWMTGTMLKPSGQHHPNIHGPYGVYTTSDGGHFLFAAAQTNDAWDAFWVFAESPMEALDPQWDTPAKRFGNGASELDAQLIQAKMRVAFAKHTTTEWATFLRSQPRIVYERVQDYFDLMQDPQARANRYVEEMDLPGSGLAAVVGNLVTFGKTPASTRGAPPLLGADTAAVLAALDFDEEAIATIEADVEAARADLLAALDP